MPQALSRAFRNRFVELHFDEIPSGELVEILQRRCQLPQSYSQLLVKVMLELQVSAIVLHAVQMSVLYGLWSRKTSLLHFLVRWCKRHETKLWYYLILYNDLLIYCSTYHNLSYDKWRMLKGEAEGCKMAMWGLQ